MPGISGGATALRHGAELAAQRDLARAKTRPPLPTELSTHQLYSSSADQSALMSTRTAVAEGVSDQCVSLIVLTRLVITELQSLILQHSLTSWIDVVWARIKQLEHDYVAWEGFKTLYASIVPTPQLECDALYMVLLENAEGDSINVGITRVAVAQFCQTLLHDGYSITLSPLPDTVSRALRTLGIRPRSQ
jgi:hypothetical protein